MYSTVLLLMPEYLRVLKGPKPVQTAVNRCQRAGQELQACLRHTESHTCRGVNNCFDIAFSEKFCM